MKLFFKKDLIIILFLLIAAVVLFFVFSSSSGNYYEISVSGEVLIKEKLQKNATHRLENGVVIICEKGEVFFYSSDCPDKICRNSGRLCKDGDWAACIPNMTFLKVVEK